MTCIFFGHHDCPSAIRPKLFEVIEKQIKRGATRFYVGNHGNYDTLVLSCLQELKQKYTSIHYAVVLAYLPTNSLLYEQEETIFPTGIEHVPKKFAIDFRNRWIVNNSDIVICYINNHLGRAYKYVQYAKKKGKEIINIAVN